MMGWDIEKKHDHCKECAELAANAIEAAIKADAPVGQSAYLNGMGESAIVLHHAKVTLNVGFAEDSQTCTTEKAT